LDGTASTGVNAIAYAWTTTDGTIDSGATTATPIVSAIGTYALTVTDTVTNCTSTDTVIVTEELIPDAGTNGNLTICEGDTVTDTQLFNSLGGSPTAGGTWSPALAGVGVYTYEVTCSGSTFTSEVTVIEQPLADAGIDGTLTICTGDTLTDVQLFGALGGTPDTGGIWSPALAGGGTYTYTVSATAPCTVDAIATVVVTEVVTPDAGTNGTLTICTGDILTENQLFTALNGTPTSGGTWSPALAGAGTYTYEVSCGGSTLTSEVVVSEQAQANAGIDDSLAICEGETVTDAQLFAALGGTPDAGGTWSPALAGGGTYTYTILATSPCSVDAMATITVIEQPLPDAGIDGTLTICTGDTYTRYRRFLVSSFNRRWYIYLYSLCNSTMYG